jgi:hypothetical protein
MDVDDHKGPYGKGGGQIADGCALLIQMGGLESSMPEQRRLGGGLSIAVRVANFEELQKIGNAQKCLHGLTKADLLLRAVRREGHGDFSGVTGGRPP